ncbi:MAG: trehalose-phosphatase [Gemmatimonadota bacterium]|nr:trehalose-phosphatase [Gemmatimonadota bacterium]
MMLDIDGTLAPLQSRPEDAFIPDATRQAVLALVDTPNVYVALVTGRAAADGRRLAGIDGAWVIGNHGIEAISPAGEAVVDSSAAPYRGAIRGAVEELVTLVGSIPGVRVEDKVWTLSVHYRLADPAIEPRVRQTMDEIAHKQGLRLIRGKKIFELRPPIHVHKGTAVLELSRSLAGPDLAASLFYAGDDRTDEDAFRALRSTAPHAVTVRVGGSADDQTAATAAEFTVADEEALRTLLEWLVTLRR